MFNIICNQMKHYLKNNTSANRNNAEKLYREVIDGSLVCGSMDANMIVDLQIPINTILTEYQTSLKAKSTELTALLAVDITKDNVSARTNLVAKKISEMLRITQCLSNVKKSLGQN